MLGHAGGEALSSFRSGFTDRYSHLIVLGLKGARGRHAETGWELNTKVRWATFADAAGIHDLLQRYAKLGRLLPRSIEEIVERLSSFLVSEQNSALAGCASLEVFTPELGEVRSLAVDPDFARLGHGRVLVE